MGHLRPINGANLHRNAPEPKKIRKRNPFGLIGGKCGAALRGIRKKERRHQGKKGKTGLMLAAEIGDDSKVGSLLEKGENANVADDQGKTALMFAAENGHTGVTTTLIAYRARAYLRDIEGKNASDYARENGHEATARHIEESLASLNRGLADARRRKSPGEANYYICHGADPNSSV